MEVTANISFNNETTSFTSAGSKGRIFFPKKRGMENRSECRYCKKGHTIDKCYKLNGQPTNFCYARGRRVTAFVQDKNHSSNVAESNDVDPSIIKTAGISQEQLQQLLALLKDKIEQLKGETEEESGTALNIFTGMHHSHNDIDDYKCIHCGNESEPWIIDSGATNNMTYKQEFFVELNILKFLSM